MSKNRKLQRGYVGKAALAGSATSVLVVASLVSAGSSRAQTPPPPNMVQLGKALFFDASLSRPAGMACATCHDPEAGFTYPISDVNQRTGEVPGAVFTRFGNRKPPSIGYTRFSPPGPPQPTPQGNTYVGGLFADGRAVNLVDQASFPLGSANEMDNNVHGFLSKTEVVSELSKSKNAIIFEQVYGTNIFHQPTDTVFNDIVQAIAAWEGSPEVNQFTSKYDAYLQGKTTLTPEELDGLRIFTGSITGRPGGPRFAVNAQCASCHSLAPDTTRPDLFTHFDYHNVGIPRNPNNPFYTQTNRTTDPFGYNPFGQNYVDYGLGDFLYPLQGQPVGNLSQNDPLSIDGKFKVPTLRNVDKRPTSDFVKAYDHNGVFKNLKQVVHFYNTRNLTTVPGEVIDFTKPNPYLGLQGKPLWPRPEVLSPKTLENPQGHGQGPGSHLGNLGLTPTQEDHLVAFLQTLSDGFLPPPH